MARKDRARPGGARSNLYDDITDKIIAELEEGRLPWVQPWGTAAAKAPLAMPRNAATARQYSGINVLILWGAVVQHGYPTQHWLTFRQALSLGGNVRKSERGTTVVYADRFTPEDEKRRAQESGEEASSNPFLKRFTVFNEAQCEGLPEDIAFEAPPPPPGMIEPKVEALIDKGRVTTDRAARAEIWQQAYTLLQDDPAWLTLYNPIRVIGLVGAHPDFAMPAHGVIDVALLPLLDGARA